MPPTKHFLSVIIPVYKQEKTISKDVENITSTLNNIRYPYEVIAVVDGTSADNSYNILKKLKLPNLKVYGYQTNHGKGYAIRFGMAKTKGDYIAFIDSGMEIDPNGISLLIEHLEWYQADIIVGSKHHPASKVHYPFFRQLLSYISWLYSKIFLGINVRDTQAGLKLFRRPVLVTILPRLLIKSFAFDMEILSVASRLGYNRIYEAPIKLTYVFEGLHLNGRFYHTLFKIGLDSLAIFYRLRLLKYYDDRNHRRWRYDPELRMRINIG